MNKKLYRFLERGADFEDRPVLSWAHIDKFDGEPVIWTTNGYAVHVVWGMAYLTGNAIPFPKTMFLENDSQSFPKHPNVIEVVKSCKPDIAYRLDTWLFRRMLTALKTNKHFDQAYLLSHNSGLYLASQDSMSYLAFGNAPDGILSFSVQLALDAIEGDSAQIGWSSTDDKQAYFLGTPKAACAYIMPIASLNDEAARDKVFSRYSKIAKAMEGAK